MKPIKNENGANSRFFLLTEPKFLVRNPKSNYDVKKVTECFNCHMATVCLKGSRLLSVVACLPILAPGMGII